MYSITVVITTYNLEQYINKCLEELNSQTMQDFDILIVDDASTDGTKLIIEKWKAVFGERLKTIFLENNLGLPALTRNVALGSGQIDGEYLLFLDGDDSIAYNMLEILYDMVNSEEDIGVAICAFNRVDTDTGNTISTEMAGFPDVLLLPPQNDTIAFINTSPWNKLWKTDLIKDLRYPMFKVGEEVAFNFMGYTRCKKIAFTDKILIHYGVRSDSVISNTSEDTIWKFANNMKELYDNQTGIYRELVGVITFVHIGLSMGLRALDNPQINIRNYIKQMESYFDTNFDWFRENRFLKISNLVKRGFKGIAIWGTLLLYKCHLFGIALFVYKKLKLNIKF